MQSRRANSDKTGCRRFGLGLVGLQVQVQVRLGQLGVPEANSLMRDRSADLVLSSSKPPRPG